MLQKKLSRAELDLQETSDAHRIALSEAVNELEMIQTELSIKVKEAGKKLEYTETHAQVKIFSKGNEMRVHICFYKRILCIWPPCAQNQLQAAHMAHQQEMHALQIHCNAREQELTVCQSEIVALRTALDAGM